MFHNKSVFEWGPTCIQKMTGINSEGHASRNDRGYLNRISDINNGIMPLPITMLLRGHSVTIYIIKSSISYFLFRSQLLLLSSKKNTWSLFDTFSPPLFIHIYPRNFCVLGTKTIFRRSNLKMPYASDENAAQYLRYYIIPVIVFLTMHRDYFKSNWVRRVSQADDGNFKRKHDREIGSIEVLDTLCTFVGG